MSGKAKVVIGAVAAVVLIYAAFVTADSIRLSKSEVGTKPLITLAEAEDTNENAGVSTRKYDGLGYSVTYRYDIGQAEDAESAGLIGYGAEFRLFGCILIWAWAE